MVESFLFPQTGEYEEFFRNSDALDRDCKSKTISPDTEFVVYINGRILYQGYDPERAMSIHEISRRSGSFIFQKTDKGEWI